MMQTDVSAVRLAASGVAVATRARVKGYHILSGGTAGSITFYDNPSAASGIQRLVVDISTSVVPVTFLLPGEGVLFLTGVYVALPATATITVLYG